MDKEKINCDDCLCHICTHNMCLEQCEDCENASKVILSKNQCENFDEELYPDEGGCPL